MTAPGAGKGLHGKLKLAISLPAPRSSCSIVGVSPSEAVIRTPPWGASFDEPRLRHET